MSNFKDLLIDLKENLSRPSTFVYTLCIILIFMSIIYFGYSQFIIQITTNNYVKWIWFVSMFIIMLTFISFTIMPFDLTIIIVVLLTLMIIIFIGFFIYFWLGSGTCGTTTTTTDEDSTTTSTVIYLIMLYFAYFISTRNSNIFQLKPYKYLLYDVASNLVTFSIAFYVMSETNQTDAISLFFSLLLLGYMVFFDGKRIYHTIKK